MSESASYPAWFSFQKTAAGSFRSQPRNPVTGRQVSITSRSLPELFAKVQNLNSLKNDLKYGNAPPEEVSQKITRAVYGAVTIREIWEAWEKTRPEEGRAPYASAWSRHIAPDIPQRSSDGRALPALKFGEARPYELTESRMRIWVLDRLERGELSAASVRWVFDCLASAFRMAKKEGKVTHIPWGEWRPPKPKTDGYAREGAGSLEEFERLIVAARGFDERAWSRGRYSVHWVVVVVGGLCGLRQGELCGLSWADVEIDGERPTMRIARQAKRGWRKKAGSAAGDTEKGPQAPTKGRRARAQQLHPDAATALRWQREELRRRDWYRPDGPVFPSPRGGVWRSSPIALVPAEFRKIAAAAGMPNLAAWSTHSLRHSFGSMELTMSGGDLKATQARLGHASPLQTAAYLHAAKRGSPTSIGALSPGAMPTQQGTAPPELPVRFLEGPQADVEGTPVVGTLGPLLAATAARAHEIEDIRKAQDVERSTALRARLQRKVTEEGAMLELVRSMSDLDLVQAGKKLPRSVQDGATYVYRVAYSKEIYHVRDLPKVEGNKRCRLQAVNASKALKGAFGRLRAEEMRKRGLTIDTREEANARRAEARKRNR